MESNAPVTTLWLVRHGETEENVAGILQGHLPGRLTPLGESQAKKLADTLRGQHFSAFYTSDLARTMATARLLQPAVGLEPQPSSLLRERDWGSLTGHRIAMVRDLPFPADVEGVDAMTQRALAFVAHVMAHHSGGQVLAVTHGLFARCLRAAVGGVTIREVPRMGNAECCPVALTPAAVRAAQNRLSAVAGDSAPATAS